MENVNNTITLTGFVGTSPEFKNLGKDFKLAQFALGVKLKGEENTKTRWHKIIAYGRYAEIINKEFKKGNRVWLKGRLIERTYTNPKGELKKVREISVYSLKKLENNNSKTIN